VELSRRGFVVGALATPLLAVLPRAAWAAPGQPFRFLSAHEGAVVEAATARLIPGPTDDPLELGHPGAREAGVVRYVDALLSAFDTDPPRIFAGGPFSGRHGGTHDDFADFQPLSALQDRFWRAEVAELQATYRAGVAALDAGAGGDYAAADPLTQDVTLTADTTGFRDVLFDHAIEGWLAAPEYGGNAGQVGWVEVRFRGDVCPEGYTPAEVSRSDGLDVIDPTGAVAGLLDQITGLLGGSAHG
jgi:hypothetical protein